MGHSMGGYGAARIGMKYADGFGSLPIMSPCCIAPRFQNHALKFFAQSLCFKPGCR